MAKQVKKRNLSSKAYRTRRLSTNMSVSEVATLLLERVTRGCCQWLETSDTLPTSTQDSSCASLLCRRLELTSFSQEDEPNSKVSSIAIYVSPPMTATPSTSDWHVRVVVSSSEPPSLGSLWRRLQSTTTIGGNALNLYLTADIKRHATASTTQTSSEECSRQEQCSEHTSPSAGGSTTTATPTACRTWSTSSETRQAESRS